MDQKFDFEKLKVYQKALDFVNRVILNYQKLQPKGSILLG